MKHGGAMWGLCVSCCFAIIKHMTEGLQLSEEAITEFIQIWERTYGVKLSRKEGARRAYQLLHFIRVVFDIHT